MGCWQLRPPIPLLPRSKLQPLPAPTCPPCLQVVMQRLMASLWLPPAAVLEWLEQHTQIRWVVGVGGRDDGVLCFLAQGRCSMAVV